MNNEDLTALEETETLAIERMNMASKKGLLTKKGTIRKPIRKRIRRWSNFNDRELKIHSNCKYSDYMEKVYWTRSVEKIKKLGNISCTRNFDSRGNGIYFEFQNRQEYNYLKLIAGYMTDGDNRIAIINEILKN